MRHAARFQHTQVVALCLCMAMLPWSTAFLSIAQMLLAASWLAGGIAQRDLLQRFRRALTSAPVLVFLSFLGLHVIGLLWSMDPPWGMDLVRILLPVLVFGLILGGSRPLSQAELRAVLLTGAWSAVVSAALCLVMAGPGVDHRTLSRFVSHIRLSMMLVLAVVVFLHYLRELPRWVQAAQVVAILFALFFISRLGSLQAVLMLGVIAMVIVWRAVSKLPVMPRSLVRSLLLLPPLALGVGILLIGRARFEPPSAELLRDPVRTAGGEMYSHDPSDLQTENGHHVWTHVAWDELYRTWPQRSLAHLDSADAKGHPVKSTLVRYLASKGLHKDSVAVMSLTDDEVTAIERGVTNAALAEQGALRRRVDELVFELQGYLATGDANGHSLTMRLEFQRTGWYLVEQHPVIGVGTGGNRAAYAGAYEALGSTLLLDNRHRAHNQFLTLLIAFGPLGLLWSLYSWWWPAWRTGAWRCPLFIAWAIVFGFSCLLDDTIETQTGATFFAMYYAVFVFAAPRSISARDPAAPAPAPA